MVEATPDRHACPLRSSRPKDDGIRRTRPGGGVDMPNVAIKALENWNTIHAAILFWHQSATDSWDVQGRNGKR
jgi:hypothetical protein